MTHLHAPRWLWIWLLLGGCGGAEPGREARLNQGFAHIQLHEARIARAESRTRPRADCAQACPGARAACSESDALCELARDLEDADALARCDRAAERCRSTRLRVRSRCGCPDG